jgi:hypothetical protein
MPGKWLGTDHRQWGAADLANEFGAVHIRVPVARRVSPALSDLLVRKVVRALSVEFNAVEPCLTATGLTGNGAGVVHSSVSRLNA